MTMTEPQTESRIAPDLYGTAWLNGEPYEVRRGDGDVVLIDFWSTTCVHCLEDLRHVNVWQRHYADAGLVVVGVHSPEYEFAFDPDHVDMVAGKYGVDHRVVLDNLGSIRSSYGIRSLPTKALVDRQGIIRYVLHGRNDLVDFERAIQFLLRESGYHGELPSLIDTAAELARQAETADLEIRCGYAGGTIGNPEGMAPESHAKYADPGMDIPFRLYIDGVWWSGRDVLRSEGKSEDSASARIVVGGGDVYLVAAGANETRSDVEVLLNGEAPPSINHGGDLRRTDEGSVRVRLSRPQAYHILTGLMDRPNNVTLRSSAGMEIYQLSILGSGDIRSIFPN